MTSIQSLEDANCALGTLRDIAFLKRNVKAEHDAEIEEVTARHAARLVFAEQPIDLVEAELHTALEAFCRSNPDEFKVTKTVDLPNGKIGFRQLPYAVELAAESPKERAIESLADVEQLLKSRVMAAVEYLLVRLNLFGRFKAAVCSMEVVRLKFEVNKAGILKAYSEGRIKDHVLASIGLSIRQPKDEFVCKPAER